MANAEETAEVTTPENDEDIDLSEDEEEGQEGSEEAADKGKGKDTSKGKKWADLTDEEKLARTERQAKSLRKKLGKDGDPAPKTKTPKSSDKKGEIGYGELAYLAAKGIEADDEVALAQEHMENTGKDLKSVVGSKFFQAELKELRELNATEAALPKGKNRSGESAKDSVEYWIAKGELPPADQVELRRKVVNAKMKAAGSGSPFSKNPVVG